MEGEGAGKKVRRVPSRLHAEYGAELRGRSHDPEITIEPRPKVRHSTNYTIQTPIRLENFIMVLASQYLADNPHKF